MPFAPILRRSSLITLLAVVLLAGAPAVGAPSAVRYVGDMFDVSLRSGSDVSHRVIKVLQTGAKVELLEKADNGWSRIRTEKGLEGWVLSRYLAEEQPARSKLEAAQQAQAAAEGERDRLKEALVQFQERVGKLEAAKSELDRIRKLSGGVLELEKENLILKEKLAEAEKALNDAKQQFQSAEQSDGTRFFLAGAGVLLLGVIGGFLLSSRPQRRNSYL